MIIFVPEAAVGRHGSITPCATGSSSTTSLEGDPRATLARGSHPHPRRLRTAQRFWNRVQAVPTRFPVTHPDVLKEMVTIPDSFFDLLPEEDLKSWEGE